MGGTLEARPRQPWAPNTLNTLSGGTCGQAAPRVLVLSHNRRGSGARGLPRPHSIPHRGPLNPCTPAFQAGTGSHVSPVGRGSGRQDRRGAGLLCQPALGVPGRVAGPPWASRPVRSQQPHRAGWTGCRHRPLLTRTRGTGQGQQGTPTPPPGTYQPPPPAGGAVLKDQAPAIPSHSTLSRGGPWGGLGSRWTGGRRPPCPRSGTKYGAGHGSVHGTGDQAEKAERPPRGPSNTPRPSRARRTRWWRRPGGLRSAHASALHVVGRANQQRNRRAASAKPRRACSMCHRGC